MKKLSPILTATAAIYFLSFCYLFAQCFIFCENLEQLQFREIDDIAFQQYLRIAHEKSKFFKLDGCAYGWLFWFPLVVITYPFYILSSQYHIDTPLILIPRFFSLFFSFATAWLLYRISSIYTKDKGIQALILLAFLSFPALGYFTQRFSTVGQTMFLSALSFYLAARKDKPSNKDLYLVALTLAAAVATKISTLLIAPLIALIILERCHWSFDKEKLKLYLKLLLIFCVGFYVLGQVNKHQVLRQMAVTQTNTGSYEGPILSLIRGIVLPTSSLSLFFLLLIGLFLERFRAYFTKSYSKRDPFYIFASLILVSLYLIHKIQAGSFYIAVYFTSISFLLPLGLLCLQSFKAPIKYSLGALLLCSNLYLNHSRLFCSKEHFQQISWNHYFMKKELPSTQKSIATYEHLRAALDPKVSLDKPFSILRDATIPGPYSGIRANITDILFFNNLHKAKEDRSFDLIGLDKKGQAFWSSGQFEKQIEGLSPTVQAGFRKNRELIQAFYKKQTLDGRTYSVIFEDDRAVYYLVKG